MKNAELKQIRFDDSNVIATSIGGPSFAHYFTVGGGFGDEEKGNGVIYFDNGNFVRTDVASVTDFYAAFKTAFGYDGDAVNINLYPDSTTGSSTTTLGGIYSAENSTGKSYDIAQGDVYDFDSAAFKFILHSSN